MTYLASVTFESEHGQPETLKTPIDAASHQKAASLAVRKAKALFPGRRPSSIVVVLELQREATAPTYRCAGGCGYPVAEPGLCGECSCEDDCAV